MNRCYHTFKYMNTLDGSEPHPPPVEDYLNLAMPAMPAWRSSELGFNSVKKISVKLEIIATGIGGNIQNAWNHQLAIRWFHCVIGIYTIQTVLLMANHRSLTSLVACVTHDGLGMVNDQVPNPSRMSNDTVRLFFWMFFWVCTSDLRSTTTQMSGARKKSSLTFHEILVGW